MLTIAGRGGHNKLALSVNVPSKGVTMIEPIPHQTPNDIAPDSSHLIIVGPLSIDLQAGCATLRAQQIQLTKLEFNVLAYLARDAGRVVSHTELLREVWGCSDGGTPSQVKNCIKRLRGKIEPDPKRPHYVLTAYGHGYFMPACVEAEQTDPIHITEFSEN